MNVLVRNSLAGKRAVVIGSGAAGMSAALALAARGARVRVFEQDAEPGGRLRPILFAGDKLSLFDQTIYFPEHLAQLFSILDLRLSDLIELEMADPLARIIFEDGEVLDLSQDRGSLIDEVARFSKADSEIFGDGLSRWAKQGQHELRRRASSYRPHRFGGIFASDLTAMIHPDNRLSLLSYCRKTFESRAPEAFFRYLAQSWGAHLAQIPSTARQIFTRQWELGAWKVVGGTNAVREALLRACQLRGIDVITETRIERIDIADQRVAGVIGDGIKPHRADIVVSTCSRQKTIDLLPRAADGSRIWKQQFSESSRSALIQFIQCDTGYSNLPKTIHWSPQEPSEAERQIFEWNTPASSPPIVIEHHPSSAGLVLKVTVPTSKLTSNFDWKNTKKLDFDYTGSLLRTIEQAGFQKLRRHIVEQASFTPIRFRNDYGRREGSLFGQNVNSFAGWHLSPSNELADASGLYLAGESAHPGPLLTQCVLSGLLVAEAAERQTTSPSPKALSQGRAS